MRTSIVPVLFKYSFIFSVMVLLGVANANAANESAQCWVEVDAIADNSADLNGKTYVISSSMQNLGEEDLEFKEVARWLDSALNHDPVKKRVYTRVQKKEEAQLLIRVAFGIGEPQTTQTTYTTAPGYSYPIGNWYYSVPPLTQNVISTSYTRRLVVEAYDLKASDGLPQIWKTSLTSTGISNDLRRILPFMITVGGTYFGTDAGHKTHTISDDAAGLAYVETWVGPLKK